MLIFSCIFYNCLAQVTLLIWSLGIQRKLATDGIFTSYMLWGCDKSAVLVYSVQKRVGVILVSLKGVTLLLQGLQV